MLKNPLNNKPSHLLETIGWILLSAYVMVLPIGHTVALRNLLFFSLITITIWLALRSRIQISVPIVKPWLLYAAIAFISLTYAIDPWYSLGEIKTEIGFGFMAMVLGATWVRTPEQFSRLVWAIIAVNVFLIAGSFYYAATLAKGEYLAVGSFNIGVGKFSTYIVLMLPFIIAHWLQLSKQHFALHAFLALLLAGNIAALYFTDNRAGLVALTVESAVLVVIILESHSPRPSWKTWAALALTILLLGALAAKQINDRNPSAANIATSISTDTRWAVWRFAAQNIEARPFTGGGLGLEAFKLLNPDYPKNNPEHNPLLWHAHNTVLNIGIQTGFPGMIAFIILMAAALLQASAPLRKTQEWNANRIYSAAAVAIFSGLAAKMQTDDFFNRDIALFFWLIVGAMSFGANITHRE
jgi:O-antigen ligase